MKFHQVVFCHLSKTIVILLSIGLPSLETKIGRALSILVASSSLIGNGNAIGKSTQDSISCLYEGFAQEGKKDRGNGPGFLPWNKTLPRETIYWISVLLARRYHTSPS